MSGVWIAGAATTPFGRTEADLRTLAHAAVADALVDAGLSAADVGQVFFGNGAAGLLQGQEMIRGQVLLRDSGLAGATMVNVENACASSSTAFQLAASSVAAGAADVALAVGAEQLVVRDRRRTFAALASATDLPARSELRSMVHAYALGEPGPATGADAGPLASPFMAHYAAKGRAYAERTGATPADLARVVVKSRAFAAGNPAAQFREPMTVEQVLAGRVIEAPLHLAMCAPIGNGAAALVLVGDRVAARLGARQVRLRGASLLSGDPRSARSPTERAAAAAYRQAGIGPDDVDLAEVHDAAAPAELLAIEALGLCGPGDAVELLRAGRTGPGGDRPVNPSGGLLSRGHPVGATGCAQLVELVTQLRGRAGGRQVGRARIGLAHNGGGVLDDDEAAISVIVLEAVGPDGRKP